MTILLGVMVYNVVIALIHGDACFVCDLNRSLF